MIFSLHLLRVYRVLILSSVAMLCACQKPPPEIALEHEHTVSQTNTAPDLNKICQDLKIQMHLILLSKKKTCQWGQLLNFTQFELKYSRVVLIH